MAVITFRFAAVYHGIRLGKGSPFNQAVVDFVSNFQAAAAIAALAAGAFVLGYCSFGNPAAMWDREGHTIDATT